MPTEAKPRRPWVAALLDLVAAPIGHMYVGRLGRGVALQVAIGVAALILMMASLRVEASAISLALLLAGVATNLLLPLDAWRLARRSTTPYRLRRYNRWYAYLAVIVAVVIVGKGVRVGVRTYLSQSYRIPSSAMEPTLIIGDHIMTEKLRFSASGLKRFDIVVFEYPVDPSKSFVHRIVGLPGETIEIRNKKVFINGAPLDEPHAAFDPNRAGHTIRRNDEMEATIVPAGRYFLLGDNRDRSYDSRFWGTLDAEKISGRARVIYFSWPRWERLGTIQ